MTRDRAAHLHNKEVNLFGKDRDVHFVSLFVVDPAVDAERRVAGVVEVDVAGAPYAHAAVGKEASREEKPKTVENLEQLQSKYLLTIPGGSLDDALAKLGRRVLVRDERIVLYQLR